MKYYNRQTVLIGLSALLIVSGSAYAGVRAYANDLPQEERDWIQSLKDGSKEWNIQTKIEADARQKALSIEQTNDGLRKALCSKYHISIDKDGNETDCPVFQ